MHVCMSMPCIYSNDRTLKAHVHHLFVCWFLGCLHACLLVYSFVGLFFLGYWSVWWYRPLGCNGKSWNDAGLWLKQKLRSRHSWMFLTEKISKLFIFSFVFFVADFSVFKLHKLLKSYQGVAAAHKMGVVSMRENLGPIIHFLFMNTNRFSFHTEWLVTWTLWAMVYRSSKWCDHSWLLCRGDTSQGIVMKWTTQYGALLTSFTVLHYCFMWPSKLFIGNMRPF